MEKRKTGLLPFIQDIAAYNLWANKTMIDWLKTKPAEKMEQEVPSSFNSIRKTITHMSETEAYWLSVIQLAPPPAPTEFGNMEEVFKGLIKTSEGFYLFLNGLTESEITKEVYLDSQWVKGDRPLYEFVQHIMNHSTYHRGQITTIGRNAGITDAPMTDYNFYNFLGR